jgi:hypothetical protein
MDLEVASALAYKEPNSYTAFQNQALSPNWERQVKALILQA